MKIEQSARSWTGGVFDDFGRSWKLMQWNT